MPTVREQILWDQWKALRKRQNISMDELDDLMYSVEKVLMNYRDAVKSRDRFKLQLKELKKEFKKQ